MHIFCDFDGTISIKDTTDAILERFAAPEWETIEAEWKAGSIGSAECMRRQIALVKATRQELNDALDALPIDPHFKPFVEFCEEAGIPVTVISDGVDYFIERILGRYELAHLPIIANRLSMVGEDSYELSSPYSNPSCSSAAGVCKCGQIGAHSKIRIFVGDGRSDFCAAGAADVLFAKTSLAEYCIREAIPFIPYQNFSDVEETLKHVLTVASRRKAEASHVFA